MSVIEVNNFPNAVYKGLAMASAGGANYLCAANFRAGIVDVFDKSLSPHSFGSGRSLWFTAGVSDEADGLFGSITCCSSNAVAAGSR